MSKILQTKHAKVWIMQKISHERNFPINLLQEWPVFYAGGSKVGTNVVAGYHFPY
jgi:hypothetical protein